MALRDMTDCAVSKRRRHNDDDESKRTKNVKFNKRQSKKVHGPFNSSEPSESPLPGRTRTLGSGHASVTLPRARRKQRTEASSAGRGFAALLSSVCLKGTRRPVCVCGLSRRANRRTKSMPACPECGDVECPLEDDCPHGVVSDMCGCCEICASVSIIAATVDTRCVAWQRTNAAAPSRQSERWSEAPDSSPQECTPTIRCHKPHSDDLIGFLGGRSLSSFVRSVTDSPRESA